MDDLAHLIHVALGLGRQAHRLLDEQVLPALPPERRSLAARLSRRIGRAEILDEEFLQDLDALLAILNRIIGDGTVTFWEADEHHVQGGCETTHMSKEAAALVPTVDELQALGTALAEALDATKALVLMAELAAN